MLIDSRLGLTELDQRLLDFVAPRIRNGSVRLMVLLTKIDKLNRSDAQRSLQEAQATLSAIATDESDIGVTTFSVLKNVGIGDVAQVLHRWLGP